MSAGTQRLHQADLVLGRHPGEHGGLLHDGCELVVVERVEVRAGASGAGQAELRGDGGGGRSVVARDHLDGNPGPPAQRDRIASFGSRGIEQADQTDQGHIVDQVDELCLARSVREVFGCQAPFGHCEDP
jgi:hypothetical protein